MKIVFAGLAIAAGMTAALQAATNAGLARSTGLGPALVVNTVIVLVGAIEALDGDGRASVALVATGATVLRA